MCFALRWLTKRSGSRVLDSNDDVYDSFTTSKKRVFDPGMTKNTSHTISIYGKMLVMHFPYNSIRTENCMKGL